MEVCCVAIGSSSFADADETPLSILKQAGVQVKPNPCKRRLSKNEIIDHLDGVDGLIAGLEPLTRDVLETAPRLKAIARVGIGMDNIDQIAAAELGVKVSNTPGGPTEAVAEMCLTALLSLKRNLGAYNTDLHHGIWKKRIGRSLQNSNILLIGYGRIGKRFGEHLRYFNANLLVCDPALKQSYLTHNEQFVSLNQGLKLADVISLHVGGSEMILGKSEFSKMQEGVIILNSARGSLIDEAALIHALNSDVVGGAWMDVYNDEPYDGPLKNFGQVLLTPHISTYTLECRRSMEESAVHNLLRDLKINSNE